MYPVLFSLGPVTVGTYGLMLAIAFLAGAFWVWKKGREEHFEEEDLFDATLICVFWGIVGARVGYVLGHGSEFWPEVVKIVAVTRFPGMEFLGGIVGGGLALSGVSRAKKWNFWEVADIGVAGLAVAQIFGYIGSFLNGSGYGIRTSLPWGVSFIGVEGGRHPTQLYAAVAWVIGFWLLAKFLGEYRTYEWYKGKSSEARAGLVAFSYLVFLGIVGLMLALLTPAENYWRSLAVRGWISMVVVMGGVVGGYVRSGRTLRNDMGGLGKSLGKLGGKKGERDGAKAGIEGKKRRRARRRGITAGVDVKNEKLKV